MTVSEILRDALKTLGKPIYRIARNLKTTQNCVRPEIYFTFGTILVTPVGYADDDNTSMLHTIRVDLYSKSDFTQLLTDTITSLKQSGFIIAAVDAELYENDTEYYHVPITVKYLEE